MKALEFIAESLLC